LPALLIDGGGVVLHATPPAQRMVPVDTARGWSLFEHVHAEDRDALRAWLDELLASGLDRSVHVEVRLAGEPVRSVELQGSNLRSEQRVRCIAVLVGDTTERLAREQALAHDALHDHLTSLGNRVLLKDRLQQAAGAGLGVSVIVFDVDRFKQVNDTHGHAVGDEVLNTIARRFSEVVPAGSTLARLGGDEFALVLPRATDGSAADVAERVLATLRLPIETTGGPIAVSVCAGITTIRGRGRPDELLRRADTALYRAKALGAGCLVAFRDDDVGDATSTELLNRLRAEKAELERLVGTDDLMGIGNRRRYGERLGHIEARALADAAPYSLLFCDVDDFGAYNNAYGQAAGDQALRTVAAAIVRELRSGDEVHRRGGEELVVLLPATARAEAFAVAERVRGSVEAAAIERRDGPAPSVVTISIGVGDLDPDAPITAAEVEAAAHRAMRRAKALGKNRVE
jgi:diguanylate cyclase (GGDEF)-like protein